MGEDDGDAGKGRIIGLVDLDVQQRAVVDGQFDDLRVKALEDPLVIGPRGSRDERTLDCGSQCSTGREGAGRQQSAAGNLQRIRDVVAHRAPTYRRGTRAPTRVTIS
ncbi:unannotated protein [freshwater metagenome]|uniref:Unannotated protein n=1 Tax=freshwater metagenome TaxID=449393 RepID=A0A6J7D8L7_9ZZZZ